ncbi:MAG: formylglycine-generating enzyme family protein [Lentisphaerae bacterium]|nr:formylglycine-generating enzyme family protein [Lentisphaerota bacterium]
MRKTTSWLARSAAAVLAAGVVNAAEPAAAKSPWPLWDGKESVADYAKRAGIKDVETSLDLGGGVKLKMTLIPAGKYLRGLREEEVETIEGVRVLVREADKGWSPSVGPQREVTISKPFYMGVYEVTQEQFEQVMGFNPSAVEDNIWPATDFKPEMFVGKNRAVNNIRNTGASMSVNPKDGWADAFCEKVSAKAGMKVSLPTAAQWEYACRAGTTTTFYWGDDPAEASKYENLGDKSFTKAGLCKYTQQFTYRNENQDDGFDKMAPVGSFKPNPWGLYDMLGNVFEWVSDWAPSYYFGAPTIDPAGPAYTVGGAWRIWKGGCFSSGPGGAFGHPVHGPPIFVQFGFRVVAALPSVGAPVQAAKAASVAASAKDKKAPKAAGPADPQARVPAGCRAAPGTQAEPYTKSGWAQAIVHEASGLEMVYVPAGSFLMGTSKEAKESPYVHDGAQRRVTLTKGFYMGKTEVTQAQWEKVMGQNPSHFKNVGPEAPVESVTWGDCQAFVQKAGSGLRLPTETEWEYACRAGTEGMYAEELNEMGWYRENSDDTTHTVGTMKPNAWGLYDMHGNVWEWCQDYYSSLSEDEVTDPTGPKELGGMRPRVIRGGGWGDYSSFCRSATRTAIDTTDYSGKPGVSGTTHIGCRVVLTAAGAP